MAQDANKKFYFDVISQKDKLSFLTRALNDKLKAEILAKGDDKDSAETFNITGFDHTTAKLTLHLDKKGFLGSFKSSRNIDKEILIKIPYDNIYLFTNTFLNYNPHNDSYSVSMLADVYKSQQRSNYRLEANRFIKIQFKINDQVYSALDVSAGGTSFNCLPEEQTHFSKGSIFKDLKIKVADSTFDIPEAKIASIQSAPFRDKFGNETEVFKVGVAFIDLPKSTEEELTITINAEARGEELRKMHAAKSQN